VSKSEKKLLVYSYRFKFKDNKEETFQVTLDPETLTVIKNDSEPFPDWASFDNFQCDICPIENKSNGFCPVAINLIDIIKFFSNIHSYEEIELEVTTPERTYSKETTVQVGVGGILGILMPSSGCPTFGKLKPLVRFHLPFASLQETEFRVYSMYLLAQYVRMKKGQSADWDMKGLKQVYEDIQKLNVNIAQKIADLEAQDASINAVVVLNNFADTISFSLDEDDLSNIETLFNDYFDPTED
jgi:hypothetical protein